MALKPCKECGAQISNTVTKCPQCGAMTTLGAVRYLGCLMFVGGIIITAIVVGLAFC